MFRIIVFSFLLLPIIFILIWICTIKLLYQNNHCLYIRQRNSSKNFLLNPRIIDSRLKLNHFTILGTHNSYHQETLFYKYQHTNLENQLIDGIRQIELDIHLMSNNNVVYHLQILDDKTNCYCLTNCFERILIWSENNSYHYPIYLFIEIKQMFYEDFFTSLNGGINCKHFHMIKEEILQIFSINSLILSEQIQGNQSSINLALKKQRKNELNGDFTYRNYGWPSVYHSLGKFIPVFIDDTHNIVENLISTCEPLSNFFFIAQTNPNLNYASIISLKNPYLITEYTNSGHLIRILLGYNGKQLLEKYHHAIKYGVHIISTDSVQCNHTELCQHVLTDFNKTSPIICNRYLAPSFCNTSMLFA